MAFGVLRKAHSTPGVSSSTQGDVGQAKKRVLTWCADRPLGQFHIETFKISSCLRKATVVNAAGLAKASHIGSWDMWTVLPGSWLPKLPNRWARALALL